MRFPKTRWVLATISLAAAVKTIAIGLKLPGIGGVGHLILGMGSFVFAVIIIAPETAVRVAEWCAKPLTDLIFPSEQFKKPPLSYRLARKYAASLRLEDAIREYRNIIHFYPEEADAYRELLIVARKAGERQIFDKYSKRLFRRFGEQPSAWDDE